MGGKDTVISAGGTMFTTAPLNEIVSSHGAEPGDVIVVTKETALNSSSILAMSFPETIKNNLGNVVFQKACDNFYETSSLKEIGRATSELQSRPHLVCRLL